MLGKFNLRQEIQKRLRKRREDTARQQFSRAAGEVSALTSRLTRLHELLGIHTQALREMLAEGGDAMNFRLYNQCISAVRQDIAENNRQLRSARQSLYQSQCELTEAIRQRRRFDVLNGKENTPMQEMLTGN